MLGCSLCKVVFSKPYCSYCEQIKDFYKKDPPKDNQRERRVRRVRRVRRNWSDLKREIARKEWNKKVLDFLS